MATQGHHEPIGIEALTEAIAVSAEILERDDAEVVEFANNGKRRWLRIIFGDGRRYVMAADVRKEGPG